VQHCFWQPGRGHDRNIQQARSLRGMIDYLHLNPVRTGLVDTARDWTWSSAGWFEELPCNDLRPDAIPWDELEGCPIDQPENFRGFPTFSPAAIRLQLPSVQPRPPSRTPYSESMEIQRVTLSS